MLVNLIPSMIFILLCSLLVIYLKKLINCRLYKTFLNYFIILTVLLLVVTIVIYPAQSVEAAYDGLLIWATLVVPALLPFFIGSELLINLGIVKFIGIMLEPIMRPVFNVPGEGSFAFAMSITSGYPVGAKIVSRLKLDKALTEVEAQRLISFCSTSGPLFMIGSVSVGMFKSSKLGIFIAGCHYLASIIVGIIFSFYKKSSGYDKSNKPREGLLKRALFEIKKNKNQTLHIGSILGDAVRNSFNTILLVGGFIILFAVVIRMLELLGLINFLTSVIVAIIPFRVSSITVYSLITGLFEVTTGTKLVIDNININLATKVSLVSFIIGWSGFSIHAQVASIIGNTGIKSNVYLLSKALHGLFSSLLAYVFFPLFRHRFMASLPVYSSYTSMKLYKKFLLNCWISAELFIVIVTSLFVLSLLTPYLLKVVSLFARKKTD